MKKLKRTYLQKLTNSRDLEPIGAVDANERAVEENSAFDELSSVRIPPPNRERMLASAYELADDIELDQEERKMNPIMNLFAGKRWYTRLAVVAALLLVVAATMTITLVPNGDGNGGVSLQPAAPALAAQPGYLMAAYTDAADKAEAQEKAGKIELLVQELLKLKQVELEELEQAVAQLEGALAEQQALVELRESGAELDETQLRRLQQVEQRLAEQARQLEIEGSQLAEQLSLREMELKEKGEALRVQLEQLPALRELKLSSKVRQGANGEFEVLLAMPQLSTVAADELRAKLAQVAELKDVRISGATFVSPGGAEGGTYTVKAGDGGAQYVYEVVSSTVGGSDVNVEVEEIDGQVVVTIVDADGEHLVLGKEGEFSKGIYPPSSPPEQYTIRVFEDGGDDGGGKFEVRADSIVLMREYDRLEATELELKELESLGSVYFGEDSDWLDIRTGLEEQEGYYFFDGSEDIDKALEELNGKLEGYRFSSGEDSSFTFTTPEGAQGGAMFKFYEDGKELLPGWTRGEDGELDDYLLELKEGAAAGAYSLSLADGQYLFNGNGDTLSIALGEELFKTADGQEQFGWVSGDEHGSFVFIGDSDDDVRIIRLGEASVTIGDASGFEAEIAEIEKYLKQHYSGQDAGFKATGKDGRLLVKVLVDGEVAAVLETERASDGSIAIINKS